MFVYSVKTSKAKIFSVVLALIISVAAIFFVLNKKQEPVTNDPAISYKAENAAERAAFLSQFGWKISEDPVEVSEVIIPADFDAGYLKYAEMNKAQGLDLEPYKGMRAKRWTYNILNYPGLENQSGVQANLLIFEGRIIGGDISSLDLGGFMHGFDFPAVPQTTAPPLSVTEIPIETTTAG